MWLTTSHSCVGTRPLGEGSDRHEHLGVSGAVSQGLARKALTDAVEGEADAVVCDYSITELHEVFDRKFPAEVGLLPQFMAYLASGVTIVSTPEHAEPDEPVLRDPKDQPIPSAARAAEADLILTGDKDLRDAGLTRPKVVDPRDFLAR